MKKNPLFNDAPNKQAEQATLTPKQKAVLDFISSFAQSHGYAPSQQEIAKHFGFSSLGTVQNYLVRLERQGVLSKSWNGKRALQTVQPSPPRQDSLELPLLGKVAAGKPIEAALANETIEIPPSMRKAGELYALKVQGDSMIEDGILDGDYVVIKRQSHANNGETVVAMVNNEATIKKYYKKADTIELVPANSKMKPIKIKPSDNSPFRIDGILVGLLRHI